MATLLLALIPRCATRRLSHAKHRMADTCLSPRVMLLRLHKKLELQKQKEKEIMALMPGKLSWSTHPMMMAGTLQATVVRCLSSRRAAQLADWACRSLLAGRPNRSGLNEDFYDLVRLLRQNPWQQC